MNSGWEVYQPTDQEPWDLRRVVHLHRRVVFGACRSEIDRDRKDGPQAAVTRILEGKVRGEGVPQNFERLAEMIGQSAVDSGSLDRLTAWWLLRCLSSPDPLRERLSLMWHNHFATSNRKVNDTRLMKQQNDVIRKLALSPFGELLSAMSHDPALLIWLDAPINKSGRPNENLAREMMELFTLGVGHYQETDVREAARALTGCTVRRGQYLFNTDAHDSAEKTILGRTGRWTNDDFVQILLEQPGIADRMAWRLIGEFFGEAVVDAEAKREFADGLRSHNLDTRWGIETILRSQLFFSTANLESRVNDPVSFLLMPLRALECWRSSPSTLVMAEWVGRMGQSLFAPPNVGGWDGGRTWLSTRTIIARANYAAAVAEGRVSSPARIPDIQRCLTASGIPIDRASGVGLLSELLFGIRDPDVIERITSEISHEQDADIALRMTFERLMRLPQAFLH